MKITFPRSFGGQGIKIRHQAIGRTKITVGENELQEGVDYFIEDTENKKEVEVYYEWMNQSIYWVYE